MESSKEDDISRLRMLLESNGISFTSTNQCPACHCIRIVSRMSSSKLSLIKFCRNEEDSFDCCCVCHLEDDRDLGMQGARLDVGSEEERSDVCCDCRSICRSLLDKVLRC